MRARSFRLLSSAALSALMFAGCTPGAGTFGFTAAKSPDAAARASRALLYVVRRGTIAHPYSVISILTFPQGKAVASITSYGSPGGICVGASGNLWVPYWRKHHPVVAEFAHGGTKAIAELALPKGVDAQGCAVDPSTGGLAVASATGRVYVWPGPPKGKPSVYSTPFEPLSAAYDNAGNLFITGFSGSIPTLQVGELPKGASTVESIKLDRPVGAAGGVQWDGEYVALATGSQGLRGGRIYRVRVSGSTGHVVEAVKLERLYPAAAFCFYGDEVVGQGRPWTTVGVWQYPAGGKPTHYFSGSEMLDGVAVSK